MVLPFPKKIGYVPALVAAFGLAGALFAEGNPLRISVIVLALVIVTVLGFNVSGGLRSPAGSYVIALGIFSGLLGVLVKVILYEPLAQNVPNADHTLTIYLVGMTGTYVAAWAANAFAFKKPLLAGRLTQENTRQAMAGTMAAAVVLPALIGFLSRSGGNGSLSSLVNQLNLALPLTVLIAVYQQVKFTRGKSSFTWVAFLAWAYITFLGLLTYSKQGIFAASVAWIVAAAAARLRVGILQVAALTTVSVLAILILVPYSQYGRNFRGQGDTAAYQFLRHPLETRQKALAAEGAGSFQGYHWFNQPEGLLDRLTLVPIDGALIARTDQVGPLGLHNLFLYVQNLLPHFLLPGKPTINFGNDYAHEVGVLAPDDVSTGVSFSPFGEAYHLYGWWGVLLIAPTVQFVLFFVTQSVSGTTDQTPWALFYILAFSHAAAEGALNYPFYVFSVATAALIASALAIVYVMPIFGSLVVGPERLRLRQTPVVRSLPPRRRGQAAAETAGT